MKPRYFLLVFLLIPCLVQAQLWDKMTKKNSKWMSVQLGSVASSMNSPLSVAASGNYKAGKFVITGRVVLNQEVRFSELADAPPTDHLWDMGLMIGNNFKLSKSGKTVVSVALGPGWLVGKDHFADGPTSYDTRDVSVLGFPAEAGIYVMGDKMALGLSVIANLNEKIPYIGGTVSWIPIFFN